MNPTCPTPSRFRLTGTTAAKTPTYDPAAEPENGSRWAQNIHFRIPDLDPTSPNVNEEATAWAWYWQSQATWTGNLPWATSGYMSDAVEPNAPDVNGQAEWMITVWDNLQWDDPDASVVHDMVEGEIIGMNWQISRLRQPGGQLEGRLAPEWPGNHLADLVGSHRFSAGSARGCRLLRRRSNPRAGAASRPRSRSKGFRSRSSWRRAGPAASPPSSTRHEGKGGCGLHILPLPENHPHGAEPGCAPHTTRG